MSKIHIVSDIHLGSDNCQHERFFNFLEEKRDKLIINGDLFESIEIRLKKAHWKILDKLRKLTKDYEVIWVKGNHDEPHPEVIARILGVELYKTYEFKDHGRRIVCVHGDSYDKFITERPILTAMADIAYNALQKIDGEHKIAKFAKKTSKTFIRCVDKVREGAILEHRVNEHDVIITGHTHFAETKKYPNGNVYYLNCGCWTEKPCTFVEIKKGEIKLNEWAQKSS